MSRFDVVRRCYNCGAILQGEDPKKEGYVDPKLLDTPLSTVLFCEKCWADQRYNIAPKTPEVSEEYLSILQGAQASDALIVYVVDLFSFEASFVPEVVDAINGLKVLVIANKRDLLPVKAKDDELREYVAHRFRVAKISCKADDVILTSLTSIQDIAPIVERIQELRRGHDVYAIAATGAGKTLLLSSFIRGYVNPTGKPIQTLNYPGTSIPCLTIPLDRSTCMYELPGTSIENSILSKLDLGSALVVTPSQPVKGKSLSLNPGDSVFFGGLARLEFLQGERTTMHCYFASRVSIEKTHSPTPESAFFKALGRDALVPTSKTVALPSDFDAFEIQVEETGKRDIGIEGFGWFSFEGNGQRFRIFLPKGVSVYTSRAKIKGE